MPTAGVVSYPAEMVVSFVKNLDPAYPPIGTLPSLFWHIMAARMPFPTATTGIA